MAAGGPYRITVAARSGTSIAEDVLIGDVFLLASAAGSSGEFQLLGTGDLEHMAGHWQPIA